ncbi:xylan 1,4-beta-xylosidase [Povalibacter uvarum]|uniref:Xylan 1,4-beta-xylosidase n=1 Tax=Povalibacter uvarum TaxID=732238 RepID=A0A841HKX0_9GAMM|nr:glycoside hydrolase family 43 protein [Povalibacter uvarum]MBB6093506.1 xylan 1,4-beta-xylosidase [Povalibacter uvarum]
MIRNPILPGFNPDPSICRVGDDYYIATSTFEWYPGVQIHHSRNLVDWELIARPLNRAELLDMRGAPDSGGVWAPCLTWHDGLFHLVYTDVKRLDGNFKDTPNYLTTATHIDGPWSAPVYLNSSGFDPSLFHDVDGRKWLVNMIWDHRPDRSPFGGIVLQEYSPTERRLVGPTRTIFTGSDLGLAEGPHLYRFGEYYYLLTAEGGTGYNHAVTLARSKSLYGPYELHPDQHIVTARHSPDAELQRVGHGDIVQTPDGSFYMTHLCSRPLRSTRRSTLGRETALRRLTLDEDGWFRLHPSEHVPQPESPRRRYERDYAFAPATLPADFQWLRSPDPQSLFSLDAAPGRLRLYGRESVGSLFNQSLVARRQTHHCFEAETEVRFEPSNFQQAAGLICYYNSHKFHYVYVSWDERIGKHIGIMSCEADPSLACTLPIADALIPVQPGAPLRLRARVREHELLFSWALGEGPWHTIPVILDHSLLSDETGKGDSASFTGTFVGMCCQDLTGQRMPADFSSFAYRERDARDALDSARQVAAAEAI